MTDAPKKWKDLTDAEKGALLLAHHEGKRIEYQHFDKSWKAASPKWFAGTTYRIAPPKFLPLEAGNVYRTAESDWICKFVDGDLAYLVGYQGASAAYSWNAATGKARGLGGAEYDIIGLCESQETPK